MPAQPQSAWPSTALIAQWLRQMIRAGDVAPGERVPSENELASDWGTTRDPPQRALDLLEQEGMITRRRGIGSIANETDPPREITVAPGSRITARIPDPAEQAAAAAAEWEPVLVVTEPGRDERVYPAGQVIVVVPGG